MNKLTLFASFIVIIAIHYFALTFLYEKKVQVVTKPPYQKVSVQLATVQLPKPIEKPTPKPIEKPIEKKVEPKPIVEKKVFKKPIKKEAKRKLVKKVVKKKVIKKPIKKPIVKKIVKKEPIKKETPKKPVEKVVKKVAKPTKTSKKAAPKALAQSLEKQKKYKENYMTALRAAIDKNKKYPIASKRLEEQGIVTVAFTVLKSGLFKDIRVITSSGKKRLDKAALKALLKTKQYKSFPKEITKEFMELTVPIKFQLNKG